MNNPVYLMLAYYVISRAAYIMLLVNLGLWLIFFPTITMDLTTPLALVILRIMDGLVGSMIIIHREVFDYYINELNGD